MAIRITDECINCGACEPECPNNAIYEGGIQWNIAQGNKVTGIYILKSGKQVDVNEMLPAIENDYYYIVSDKCTECKGFHDEPQCAAVCPVDCCIPDEKNIETETELLAKKAKLWAE